MNRRKARENAFIAMFEATFGNDITEIIEISRQEPGEYMVDEFGEKLIHQYFENSEDIDVIISSKLKGWKFERLPRVSMSILRLAVCEMKFGEPEIDSVSINEAVELAKKYGDHGDYQFINGVLGSLYREKAEPLSAENNTSE